MIVNKNKTNNTVFFWKCQESNMSNYQRYQNDISVAGLEATPQWLDVNGCEMKALKFKNWYHFELIWFPYKITPISLFHG